MPALPAWPSNALLREHKQSTYLEKREEPLARPTKEAMPALPAWPSNTHPRERKGSPLTKQERGRRPGQAAGLLPLVPASRAGEGGPPPRSEEHTSELQSR